MSKDFIIKLIKVALALIVLFFLYLKNNHLWIFKHDVDNDKKLPIVAISQIIEHSSLDQERQGLIDYLASKGYVDGKDIKIVYQNAQGSISTSGQIANQLVSLSPKVIVAISTPSAQSVLPLCLQNHIPLVFTAVTDAMAAKIVSSYGKRSEAVTGVTDYIDPAIHLDFMLQIIPHLKTVGVIYNSSEINSVKMLEGLKAAAKVKGITIVESIATKSSEVSTATKHLVGKVQAIYLPNDNVAVSSIEQINQVAIPAKLPVFGVDNGPVISGAFAALGFDHYQLGKKTGELVIKILQKNLPQDIDVVTEHPLKIFLNTSTAEKIGLKLPNKMMAEAKIVGQLK